MEMYQFYSGKGRTETEIVDCNVLVAGSKNFALDEDDSASSIDRSAGIDWGKGSDKIGETFELRLSLVGILYFSFFGFPDLFFDEFSFSPGFHINNQ